MRNAGSDRILAVDGDPAMRHYLRELLRLQGYSPVLFSDGEAPLRYLASTPDTAGLILCDINMPGISGMELLGTVKAVLPGLPFILLSGLYEKSAALNAIHLGAPEIGALLHDIGEAAIPHSVLMKPGRLNAFGRVSDGEIDEVANRFRDRQEDPAARAADLVESSR